MVYLNTNLYHKYQRKYRNNPRESDKKIISLIGGKIKNGLIDNKCKLLDLGCSTGNLLIHLKETFSDFRLSGYDMYEEVLSMCKADPKLQGIDIALFDILKDKPTEKFDVIVVNAVVHLFQKNEFIAVVEKISEMLGPNGWFFCFDYFHPLEQEIIFVEKSIDYPDGLPPYVIRPYSHVSEAAALAGFTEVEFYPFEMPFDLEKPDNYESVQTYTVRTEDKKRLSFRGSIYQPWCHIAMQKKY